MGYGTGTSGKNQNWFRFTNDRSTPFHHPFVAPGEIPGQLQKAVGKGRVRIMGTGPKAKTIQPHFREREFIE
jgi:hypothetical protein